MKVTQPRTFEYMEDVVQTMNIAATNRLQNFNQKGFTNLV